MLLTEQTPDKTKPFFQVKDALFYPARWPLHADGLPLRPLRGQARRSTGAHSGGGGTNSSTSTFHATRRAFRDRSRWSVPSILSTLNLTQIYNPIRRIPTNVLPARSGAR